VENRKTGFEGWAVLAAIAAALVAMTAILTWQASDLVGALRVTIRATARSSLVLFMLAFTASANQRLFVSRPTDWLLRNRRQLGLGFALSHLIHLAAIVMLARTDPVLFDALTTPASFIFGGAGYVAILAMAATSFDTTARAVGPKHWARIHRIGGWFLWAMFLLNFAKRIPVSANYAIGAAIALIALGLRLAARRHNQT